MSLDDLVVMEAEQRGPIECRAAQTLDVRFPERVVEIIVTPYEEPTPILRRNGEWVVETFARTAYDGIERRASRVKVNRDHDLARTCGRAIALHPSRDVGLVAELRISETPLGDESLALAKDGALDASAGFRPMDVTWNRERTECRIERAWLHHIALTPDPAYDGANVLDVRSALGDEVVADATTGTPRLDTVLARLAEIGYRPRAK